MHYQAASIYLLLNTDENNIPLSYRDRAQHSAFGYFIAGGYNRFSVPLRLNPDFLKVAIKNGILDIEKTVMRIISFG